MKRESISRIHHLKTKSEVWSDACDYSTLRFPIYSMKLR